MSRNDPFILYPSARRRGVKRVAKKEYLSPAPCQLTSRKTLEWIYRTRTDHWWKSQMPITDDAFECVLGLPDRWIYHMLAGHPSFSPKNVLPKIGRLISDIENKKLCFPKMVRGPAKKGEVKPPKFLWVNPDPETQINKISSEKAWSLWARCLSCGGNKFLPVIMNGENYVCCYTCFPPSQHRMVGAREANKSLIHEALKKYL